MNKKLTLTSLVLVTVMAAGFSIWFTNSAQASKQTGTEISIAEPLVSNHAEQANIALTANLPAPAVESQASAEQQVAPVVAVSGSLSDAESAALLYMREEEKLAHDVYTSMYTVWGLPLFQNIAASELTHTHAVKTLLDRYGLDDPASTEAGIFTNPDLQALYTDLVARGSVSLVEALKVGAAIEEIDILDLELRLAETDQLDIQQVFTNLRRGSYNHLNAFVRLYQSQTGQAYQPQYMDNAAYQAILQSLPGNRTGSINSQGGFGQGITQPGGSGRGYGRTR